MNTQKISAKQLTASVASRLIKEVNELLQAERRGDKSDDSKYAMISDLVMKFSNISDMAIQEEAESKESLMQINQWCDDVERALEKIDSLMDAFYEDHKTTFEEFENRILGVIEMTKVALSEPDIKKFLIQCGEVEERKRLFDYIPYTLCGWEEVQYDMCGELLENMDTYVNELLDKSNRLVGSDPYLH